MVKEQFSECHHDEFQQAPSNHPIHPKKVVASDPVFVNPNSHDALKKALQGVGNSWKCKTVQPQPPKCSSMAKCHNGWFPIPSLWQSC